MHSLKYVLRVERSFPTLSCHPTLAQAHSLNASIAQLISSRMSQYSSVSRSTVGPARDAAPAVNAVNGEVAEAAGAAKQYDGGQAGQRGSRSGLATPSGYRTPGSYTPSRLSSGGMTQQPQQASYNTSRLSSGGLVQQQHQQQQHDEGAVAAQDKAAAASGSAASHPGAKHAAAKEGHALPSAVESSSLSSSSTEDLRSAPPGTYKVPDSARDSGTGQYAEAFGFGQYAETFGSASFSLAGAATRDGVGTSGGVFGPGEQRPSPGVPPLRLPTAGAPQGGLTAQQGQGQPLWPNRDGSDGSAEQQYHVQGQQQHQQQDGEQGLGQQLPEDGPRVNSTTVSRLSSYSSAPGVEASLGSLLLDAHVTVPVPAPGRKASRAPGVERVGEGDEGAEGDEGDLHESEGPAGEAACGLAQRVPDAGGDASTAAEAAGLRVGPGPVAESLLRSRVSPRPSETSAGGQVDGQGQGQGQEGLDAEPSRLVVARGKTLERRAGTLPPLQLPEEAVRQEQGHSSHSHRHSHRQGRHGPEHGHSGSPAPSPHGKRTARSPLGSQPPPSPDARTHSRHRSSLDGGTERRESGQGQAPPSPMAAGEHRASPAASPRGRHHVKGNQVAPLPPPYGVRPALSCNGGRLPHGGGGRGSYAGGSMSGPPAMGSTPEALLGGNLGIAAMMMDPAVSTVQKHDKWRQRPATCVLLVSSSASVRWRTQLATTRRNSQGSS